MKSIQGLAHIAVLAKDIEMSIKFYEKLGGECYARGAVQKPAGVNQLAMVSLWGFDLELIQPGDGSAATAVDGRIPHFAVEVENLPLMIHELKAMGVDTFLTEEPVVLPGLFGGLRNIFFTGPDGEQIELIEHFN